MTDTTVAIEKPALTSNELSQVRTDLSVSRTLMSADRTLMAWVRTSLSLISFGFTIYKILEGFAEAGADLPSGETPRNIGLFLTGMGSFAMVMGTIEYWQSLKGLQQIEHFKPIRPALVMAVLMSVTGVTCFVAIITRIL